MKRSNITTCAVLATFCLSYAALADDSMSMSGKTSAMNSKATLTVQLLNQDKESKEGAAEVQVMAKNIKLVDPSKSGEMAKSGQGHIHYQMDSGLIIATPASKLEFHGLAPGKHTLTVTLANNDHTPIGMPQSIDLTIPQAGAAGTVGTENGIMGSGESSAHTPSNSGSSGN